MTLKKLLSGLGWLLFLLCLALVAILWLFDFGRFKPQIETAVTDATGRVFRIDGDLHVKVLPAPSVTAGRVTLANAPWGDSPDMLQAGHVSARIDLWSLLFPPVVIQDIRLQDVKLLLEVNQEGDGNWMMPGAEPESPEAGEESGEESGKESGEPFRVPVDIRFAEIGNVDIEYRAAGADGSRLQFASLGIRTDETGLHVLSGQGAFSELPFTLEGTVGNRKVGLDLTLDRVAFRSVSEYSDHTVDFSATLDPMDEVGRLLEIDNLPGERLALRGSAALEGNAVRLSDVLAELGSIRITVDGRVSGDQTELSIDARGPSMRELRPELPEIPFNLQASMQRTAEGLSIDPIEAGFGESDLSGSLKLPQGTSAPIVVRAGASLIDLAPFLSTEEGEDDGSQSDDGEAAQAPETYVFTTEPLPLDALRQLAFDGQFEVKRLKTSTDEFRDLQVVATAGEGSLDIEQHFSGSKGGSYRGQAELAVTPERMDLTLSARAENLRLGLLSGPEIDAQSIPATSITMDISASGGTARALAAGANGRLLVIAGPGLVENAVMETVSGSLLAKLFQALNPLAEQEQFSHWECTVFSLDVADGLGEVGGLLMQSDKLMIVGRGEIDLRTEQLDFEFNTKPREGVGLSADMFVTPFVKLTGTLADPTVGLNKSGTLVSGGAAVLTGGMSFLFKGLMDRATAQKDQCKSALEAVGAGLE